MIIMRTKENNSSLSEKIAATTDESLSARLKSGLFTEDARKTLEDRAHATVIVLFDTRVNGGKRELDNLMRTVAAAPEENILAKPNLKNSSVEITAPSKAIVALTQLEDVAEGITEVYVNEELEKESFGMSQFMQYA